MCLQVCVECEPETVVFVIGCNVMCVSAGVCVECEPETGVCDWL